MSRRIVITGVGMITPVGLSCKESWDNVINSISGIKKISRFNTEGMPDSVSKVAGEIDFYNKSQEDTEVYLSSFLNEKKDIRKTDRFIWYSMVAAEEALSDADWKPKDEYNLERTGVLVGSGVGGITTIQNNSIDFFNKGIKKVSPFFVPASITNLVSGQISIKYGFSGPNISIATACASGTHSIGEGMEIIKRDDADVMIVGGTEAPLCEVSVGGFSSMHALSTNFNNNPQKASRPWDRDRDGFVIAEGAGIIVLEEYEHAKKRGAKIYCEVVGYGTSGDAFHITTPETNGKGAIKAISKALSKAKLNPENIDYINAHGTSTQLGDVAEFKAVNSIFSKNNNLCMSSTKSATGHLLGAAGAVEAIFSAKVIETGKIPPTLNLDNIDENCKGLDLVPYFSKEKKVNYVLSNSFGFGGTNASIILGKI